MGSQSRWGTRRNEFEGGVCVHGKAVSKTFIWEAKSKIGFQHNTYSLQQYPYRRPILGIRKGITQIWVSSLLETHLQRVLSFRSCCWRRLKISI